MSENNFYHIPEEFKKYIRFKFGTFSVKNDKNGLLITFGRFSSLDIACAATRLLIKYDWNMVDVADSPIHNYLDEYYVFNVMNNHLIFDRKFSSFEKAVEYLELNPKCNNYNQDIFSKKKRKPKYSNIVTQVIDDVPIPNIYPKYDSYVVKYKRNGKEYGVFNSMEEAIVAKNLLIENNWKFSNNVEMKFYNSFYWIFEIRSNVVSYVDKFESYEEALDCLNLYKLNEYENSRVNHKIEDGFKKPQSVASKNNSNRISKKATGRSVKKTKTSNPKKKNKKGSGRSVKKTKTSNHNKRLPSRFIPRTKYKFTQDNIKIKKIDEFKKETFQIDTENLKSEFHIIQFQDNTLNDYYSISFSSEGEIKFSDNIQKLKEFGYILKILNVNDWNLSKINNSSSIHYFNDFYYIIKSFNGKLIISGSFNSYGEAEDNIEFLYDYYSIDKFISEDIQKHGNYYKYIGEHHKKIFQIAYQESYETLKAMIDILDYYDWDPNEFDDYNIYYYHGLYWEIDYFNYYVKLKGRFYSKDDAIKHKINY